jgi:hypothetical protein
MIKWTPTDFASLATAAVGLIGMLYTILKDRNTKPDLLGDAESLNIVRIKRYPLDENMWHKMKWRKVQFLIREITLTVFAILLLIALASFLEGTNIGISEPIDLSSGRVIAVIVILITYLFLAMHVVYSFFIWGRSPEEARFFIFREAEIQVEATYPYLLNRCREVLLVMHARQIEIDAEKHCLEAYLGQQLTAVAGRMTVHIEPKPETSYLVTVNFSACSTALFLLLPLFPKEEAESRAINRFISQLMGQPEMKQDKGK